MFVGSCVGSDTRFVPSPRRRAAGRSPHDRWLSKAKASVVARWPVALVHAASGRHDLSFSPLGRWEARKAPDQRQGPRIRLLLVARRQAVGILLRQDSTPSG